jgi:phosphatidylglycerol lysyltransferase
VMESVHVTLPFTVVFAIFTLSILAGIASLIPGGLGASDLSQVVLLASQGVPLPEATNIVLLWRIVMYLPIVLVIGIYLAGTRTRIEHFCD